MDTNFFIHSFIHSFSKYLRRSCCIQDKVSLWLSHCRVIHFCNSLCVELEPYTQLNEIQSIRRYGLCSKGAYLFFRAIYKTFTLIYGLLLSKKYILLLFLILSASFMFSYSQNYLEFSTLKNVQF